MNKIYRDWNLKYNILKNTNKGNEPVLITFINMVNFSGQKNYQKLKTEAKIGSLIVHACF